MDQLNNLRNRHGSPLRHAALIVLIVFVGISLPVTSAVAISGDESIKLYRLIDNGKLKAADKEASDLLSDNPGDPIVLFVQALIAEKSGDTDQAIALYRRLTRSHPSLLEAYNNLAIQLASKGDMKAAVATLERAMRVNPAVATAYRNLTAIYAQMASAAYRKALNSTTPLLPLQLATIDKIQSPGTRAPERPTLVASVENFVNESIADSASDAGSAAASTNSVSPEPDPTDAIVLEPDEKSTEPTTTDSAQTNSEEVVQSKPALQPLEPAAAPSSSETKPAVVAAAAPEPEKIPDTNAVVAEPEPEPAPKPTPAIASEPAVTDTRVAASQPAVIRPSDEARKAAEQVAREKQALINHIKSWASAWADRDVDRYLGHYSSSFKPRNGLSLAEWKKQRYGRLRWREFIVVEPSNYNIDLDKEQATVNFTQYYKSDRLEDTIRKTLKFRKEENQWRIVRELI